MIPAKLKKGDEIRIIAPSSSFQVLKSEQIKTSEGRLKELGFKVTYGKHLDEMDEFDSSSIESRISDLHDAFSDQNVKAVLCTIGGFNVNQLLKYIDYDQIRNNPKIFCGYSDITAIATAMYVKAGLITYSGPGFASFSMQKGFEYTMEYFVKCLTEEKAFTAEPSEMWSDDLWFHDQENREFINNEGPMIINEGKSEGTIIGGNLCTLNLLQGTEYMPSLKDSILFIEDDYEVHPKTFDRDLQSLLHLPDSDGIKAVLIGRFQKETNMSDSLLRKIISSKKELHGIPVIANVNFGHVSPIFTFPIGGTAKVEAEGGRFTLKIVRH